MEDDALEQWHYRALYDAAEALWKAFAHYQGKRVKVPFENLTLEQREGWMKKASVAMGFGGEI